MAWFCSASPEERRYDEADRGHRHDDGGHPADDIEQANVVRSPIAARSFDTSITRTSSGAAIRPLSTALSEIVAYFIILATGSSVIITRAPSTQP